MTLQEIEQMKADRAAGTPAPWAAFEDEVTGIKASDGRVAVCTQITLMHRRFATEVAANARRIARVPDLEAEILRLREALDGIYTYANDTLSGRADGGPDDRAWQRAAVVEIRNRARPFAKTLNGDAP